MQRLETWLQARMGRLLSFVALVFAALVWMAITVGTALVRGEGHTAVFWITIVLFCLILVGLFYLLYRGICCLRGSR